MIESQKWRRMSDFTCLYASKTRSSIKWCIFQLEASYMRLKYFFIRVCVIVVRLIFTCILILIFCSEQSNKVTSLSRGSHENRIKFHFSCHLRIKCKKRSIGSWQKLRHNSHAPDSGRRGTTMHIDVVHRRKHSRSI